LSDQDQQPNPTETENRRLLMPPSPPFDIQLEKAADVQDAQDRFIRTWEEFNFNIGKACKFAEVSRLTVDRWREYDPEFAQRMDEIKQAQHDNVEERLVHQATNPDVPAGAQVKAIEIYLKAHRPDLYNPKREGSSGPVNIRIVLGKRPKDSDAPSKTIDVKATDGS
jgi:hypothetical protein